MKADCVIMSVNDDDYYYTMWPAVSLVWKCYMQIEPILVHVGRLDLSKASHYGRVVELRDLGVDSSFQAQWARFYYASTLDCKVSIISDIDMFPIRKSYFINQIANIRDYEYVHINPVNMDCGLKIPVCYHVATGWNYKDFLEIPDEWDDAIAKMMNYARGRETGFGNSPFWCLDETYTTHMLQSKDVVLLERPKQEGRDSHDSYRLNRSEHGTLDYDPKTLRDSYIDCHCIRPYHNYTKQIDQFVRDLTGLELVLNY